MGMPGLRRPLDGEDEVHAFTRPPRDFEETGEGGYRFTIGPADLEPPLSDWLEEGGPVTVDYHTDVDGPAKARFELRPGEPERIGGDDWTEQPTQVLLHPPDE